MNEDIYKELYKKMGLKEMDSEVLINAYEKALRYGLNEEFIRMLWKEIERRNNIVDSNIKIPTSD